MTKKEIVAIATQAAIAAIEAMNAQNNVPVSNPTTKATKPKTKALPDAKANAIGDIVASATTEAVENGKTIEVPKGKAILMEYSEKQLAIWGDTKEHRAIIKKYGGEKTTRFGTIWGYKPEGVTEENMAKGWFIPKSKLTENGGHKAMIAELKKAGLKVTIGESIRAITEAYRAAHPRDEKPATEEKPKAESKPKATKESKPKNTKQTAKVVPIKVDEYTGIAYGQVAIENGATFKCYPDNPDLYIRDKQLYVCIGNTGGESTFLHIGNKKDNAIPEPIKQVAEKGILVAISEGIIKNVLPYIVEAFKSLDNQDGYNWLVQAGYATAA
jgi:hypothetical protein